jgi:hypothetical protein
MGDDADDPRTAATAAAEPVLGRRRRKTLAPGGLVCKAAGPLTAGTNSIEELVEVLDGFSSDDSCESEIPFEAAMEVVRSPVLTTVAHRGSRSDEELATSFWSEIGFLTPVSRFWETSTPAPAGTSSFSSVCREDGSATDLTPPVKPAAAAGAGKTPSAAPRGVDVRRPPRAGTWRGPVRRDGFPSRRCWANSLWLRQVRRGRSRPWLRARRGRRGWWSRRRFKIRGRGRDYRCRLLGPTGFFHGPVWAQ